MTTYTFTCPTTRQRWQRVHAFKAKSLFAKGIELRGIPCKQALFGAWSNGGFTAILITGDPDTPERQFERWDNGIAAHNCCSQLGYSVAWYAKEEEIINKCK